jgi:hypothetical protein
MVLLKNRQTAKGGSLPESGGGWAGSVAGFLGGAVATCVAIHAALPLRPDVPVISAKLRQLAAETRCDTLFLGTSRTYHQVSPETFDERMGALGFPTCSYNLGADGLNFPETFFVLDAALARLPRPPRLVVLELGGMQWGENGLANADSTRAVYWHTWRHTALVWRSMLHSPGRTATFAQAAEHGHLLLLHYSNLGRSREILPALLATPSAPRNEAAAPRGFAPIDHGMTAAQSADFHARLGSRIPNPALPTRADPALSGAFTQLVERLRLRGTETLFVLMPAFRRDLPPLPRDAAGQPVAVVDLDDPQRTPELWHAEHRYDPHHLNSTGSELFTRLLADSVATRLAAAASR